ncbi:TRAP transporter large permease subunit [Pelagibacterium lacus]|uniref:TRAP transporter permease DctM n=1 Tax=Pelagibacterium lacus TaxID=2282655 RepID=A0A369W6W0_9HYPH|nr:TRAP transporter large permease subunit [Pelagibacterium lacus]RDE07811.1 TRAP transporter permease DctM [Pelagibacterium lacus]
MRTKETLAGKTFSVIVSSFNTLGAIWIFGLVLLVTADVLLRTLLNMPLPGVALIVSFSIVPIVFLQIADATRLGRTTRNMVALGRLIEERPRSGRLFEAVFHLLGAVSFSIVAYYTWPRLTRAWEDGTYFGTEVVYTIPQWPLFFSITLGSVLAAAQFIRLAVGNLRLAAKLPPAPAGAGGRSFLLLFTIATACIVAFGIAAMAGFLSTEMIGLLSVVVILLLIYSGAEISVVLAFTSFACIWLMRGDPTIGGRLLSSAAATSIFQYEFGVIPLFVLMGLFAGAAGIGKDIYDIANQLFRRVLGGLGMATVLANAVFAAVTGTSIASASVFTKISVPEMIARGYNPRFAVGVVAGSSVLGMLIPPSLLLILYGILTEQSIGDLFIAGILPGLFLAVSYIAMIYVMARFLPRSVITKPVQPEAEEEEGELLSASQMLVKATPVAVLILLIIGGIYGGFFTPTEAGGVGAALALLLVFLKGKLNWSIFWQALRETGHVTSSICFLLVGASIYTKMLAFAGLPNVMQDHMLGLGLDAHGMVILFLVAALILGTILDAGSVLLILVPMMIGTMHAFGVDLIWLGILMVIAVEIGLLTPPVGVSPFVIHSNLRDSSITLNDIFIGAAPFALMMVVVLGIIFMFPWIATILVR